MQGTVDRPRRNAQCAGDVLDANGHAGPILSRRPATAFRLKAEATLSLPELLRAQDSRALANHYELIGRHRTDLFSRAVWPPDRQIGGCRAPEPEMQPAIVGGIEAGLGRHFLGLAAPAILSDHSRADCAPVRRHAFQQHLQPVALSR